MWSSNYCPKNQVKKKGIYKKTHNLQQYLNYHLLKSTAMGKQDIKLCKVCERSAFFLKVNTRRSKIIPCASNGLAKWSPSDWDTMSNTLPAWTPRSKQHRQLNHSSPNNNDSPWMLFSSTWKSSIIKDIRMRCEQCSVSWMPVCAHTTFNCSVHRQAIRLVRCTLFIAVRNHKQKCLFKEVILVNKPKKQRAFLRRLLQ